MDYADRDIRERQLRGSSSGKYLESTHVRREIIPVFANHVREEAPPSQRKLVTEVQTSSARGNVHVGGGLNANVNIQQSNGGVELYEIKKTGGVSHQVQGGGVNFNVSGGHGYGVSAPTVNVQRNVHVQGGGVNMNV